MMDRKNKKPDFAFWISLVLLLLLIFFSHRNPESTHLTSKLLNTVITPVNSVFYSLSESAYSLYERVFGDQEREEELARLEKENIRLQDDLNRLASVIGESEFLVAEAELRRLNGDQMVEAHVATMDSSIPFVRFTINKGSLSGLQVGDIVVEGVKEEDGASVAGLVGRVYEVGPNYAKVSSVLDASNNIAVLFLDSQGYGIINNRDREALFGYLLDPQTPVQEGEQVVTSGIGGVYPRGVLLGRVKAVEAAKDGLTKNVDVEAAVDFDRLYQVLVFHPEEEESIHLKGENHE